MADYTWSSTIEAQADLQGSMALEVPLVLVAGAAVIGTPTNSIASVIEVGGELIGTFTDTHAIRGVVGGGAELSVTFTTDGWNNRITAGAQPVTNYASAEGWQHIEMHAALSVSYVGGGYNPLVASSAQVRANVAVVMRATIEAGGELVGNLEAVAGVPPLLSVPVEVTGPYQLVESSWSTIESPAVVVEAEKVVRGRAELRGAWNVTPKRAVILAGAYPYVGFNSAISLTPAERTITKGVTLLGTLVVERSTARNADGRVAELGYRPSSSYLVHAVNVETVDDVEDANVPEGGRFLMAPDYIPETGSPFAEAGAVQGAIGTRLATALGDIYYVFRAPYEREVVWYIAINNDASVVDKGFYRHDRDAWNPYKTVPERAIEGMTAFDATDPDKVYTYFARLVGNAMAQWSYDTYRLLDFMDATTCPSAFLYDLAAQFGAYITEDDSDHQRRERIRNAIRTHKEKGLEFAVWIALRTFGLTGYAREVWWSPDATDWYFESAAPADVQATIDRLGVNIPGPSSPEEAAELGIGEFSNKGSKLIEVPHGNRTEMPEEDGYWPTSRLVLHVRNNDRTPLLSLSDGATADLIRRVTTYLLNSVLPVHVDIRYISTDAEIGGCHHLVTDIPGPTEEVGIADALAITEV